MPNFNNFKTSNLGYFPRPQPGKPAFKLDQSSNWVDDIVDQVAGIHAAVQPADETVADPEAVTVGPSPYTHICGTESEQLFIFGGDNVIAVERWSETASAWVAITDALPVSVMLPPGGQLRITYTGTAPTVIQDAGNFNNAAGVTEVVTPGASPYTHTAGGRAERLYISGGAINSITRNGVEIATQVPCQVTLPRGGSVVIDYNTAPTIVRDC